jgi:predicted CXXCH cytochrome family protein
MNTSVARSWLLIIGITIGGLGTVTSATTLHATSSETSCISCHKMDEMMLALQSTKAQLYHQLLGNGNKTCIDCHADIAQPGDSANNNSAGAYAAGGAQQCLSCHDFGPQAPVHAVLSGSHGIAGEASEMAGRRGCEDCHGPGKAHSEAPMTAAPAVSFGPRWSSTSNQQDSQCLACHEDNVAQNWRHALHMLNNLTCVTCHDIHSLEDKVLFDEQQAQVCTVCHKAQKAEIPGPGDLPADKPRCTSCHNPHDHEAADAGEHEGFTHAATIPGPAVPPTAVASKEITLFYPGIADSDWLLHKHPGSQPLRQGRNCQQCHRGEEAQMGKVQAGQFEPASRRVRVSFARDTDAGQLLITLQWRGAENDRSIALMWGDGGNEAFTRAGCFAACHSDLPGMSQDRGQQTSKYLAVSRTQQHGIGQPSVVRDPAALEQLMAAGEFVEMWRIQLHNPTVEKALVLEGVQWQAAKLIWINKQYSDGQWTVAVRRGMTNNGTDKKFLSNKKYTFGIALTGVASTPAKHWVSLPMTLSFDGDDTDFIAE